LPLSYVLVLSSLYYDNLLSDSDNFSLAHISFFSYKGLISVLLLQKNQLRTL